MGWAEGTCREVGVKMILNQGGVFLSLRMWSNCLIRTRGRIWRQIDARRCVRRWRCWTERRRSFNVRCLWGSADRVAAGSRRLRLCLPGSLAEHGFCHWMTTGSRVSRGDGAFTDRIRRETGWNCCAGTLLRRGVVKFFPVRFFVACAVRLWRRRSLVRRISSLRMVKLRHTGICAVSSI